MSFWVDYQSSQRHTRLLAQRVVRATSGSTEPNAAAPVRDNTSHFVLFKSDDALVTIMMSLVENVAVTKDLLLLRGSMDRRR